MIKHLGTGIPGRPKGISNSQCNINWKAMCKDFRHYPEFKVEDNTIIYPINNDEYLQIKESKTSENKFELYYFYKGLKIKCQTMNSNGLDDLVNKLMDEDWDYSITLNAKVKTFKC